MARLDYRMQYFIARLARRVADLPAAAAAFSTTINSPVSKSRLFSLLYDGLSLFLSRKLQLLSADVSVAPSLVRRCVLASQLSLGFWLCLLFAGGLRSIERYIVYKLKRYAVNKDMDEKIHKTLTTNH